MEIISLKLPEYRLRQLEKEARTRQVTKSQLIREGIEMILEPQSLRSKGTCLVTPKGILLLQFPPKLAGAGGGRGVDADFDIDDVVSPDAVFPVETPSG